MKIKPLNPFSWSIIPINPIISIAPTYVFKQAPNIISKNQNQKIPHKNQSSLRSLDIWCKSPYTYLFMDQQIFCARPVFFRLLYALLWASSCNWWRKYIAWYICWSCLYHGKAIQKLQLFVGRHHLLLLWVAKWSGIEL